ncbi:MAG: protein BatD [Barnesiella sp.]|nr:protein BatD [Barnesiella sp.]
MKRFSFLLISICLMALSAMAQTSFNVIPPRNVIAGQRFQVVYRLSNAQGGNPKVGEIKGCQLLYGPSRSTSQSYQVINGVSTSSSTIDFTYVYRADNAGTYTIPAASIDADGKKLQTSETSFSVLPADTNAPGQSSARPGDISSQTPDKAITGNDIFVKASLNKTSVYEQEAVECTLKLYTKYDGISSFAQSSPEAYEGFLIEEVNLQNNPVGIEHYNGQNYRTVVLRKYILFPQKSGKLTLKTGAYDVVVQQYERIDNGYFYMTRPVERNVKLASSDVVINVKPLPSPAPAGFDGAVGRFDVSSSLSSTNLRTNEAASLTYKITGTGNIKYIKAPKVVFPEEFQQYSPNQDVDAHVSGSTVTGTMNVEYTFVPDAVGDFDITASPFVYFDPSKNEYVTIDLPSYSISVAKGVGVGSQDSDQKAVKIKNTDIRHIKTGDKNLSHEHNLYAQSILYWLIYPALTLALVLITIFAVKRHKANSDVVGMRKSKAGKMARRRLALASKYMQKNDKSAFYDAVLKALWGYISDKLSIPASALTRSNVSEELTRYGADESTIAHLIGVLDECEMARYTPESLNRPLKDVYDDAFNAMNELQSVSKK